MLSRLIPALLASVFLTVSCSQQPNSNGSKPIVSGVNNWVGYTGHHVAVGKKFFADEKLNVQDLFFQSASEEMSAFLAGKLDIGWFTSGDAIQMVAKDPSIKMIYLVDYSNGSDGIIGRGINTPKDLKGKTVGRENILFEKVLLRAYLQKGGLKESDVTTKDMAAADAATAFAAKKVDVAVTYEPYLSKAAKEGGGKVIFSTKDTNLIADVVVAKKSFIQSHKTELKAYFKAVDKAVKLVKAKDPDALKISAAKLGISPKELQEQLTGVKLFDLDGNKAVAFNKANPKSLIGNLDLTAKAALDFKVVPKPLKVDTLYDDSLVK